MGQRIGIENSRIADSSLLVTTDRALSGTEGEAFTSLDEACEGATFPARLAADLFESDRAISRVYAAANVVLIERQGGWQGVSIDATTTAIEEFFLYY